jgi:hypothetical protein
MGLSVDGTKFLLYAKTQGVRFARTATLGRLGLHLSAAELSKNLADFGFEASEAEGLLRGAGGFAEPFLKALGAEEVCSFDASAFEGASHTHDFNFPVGDELRGRFTAVIDGGTLEHIFDFPTAVRNCMEMLEVGGHFLGLSPVNNFVGHGLYQFSPELFFRVFGERNGFRVVRMIAYEGRPAKSWFEVADPAAVGERVSFINSQPATLLVLAEKVASVEVFASPPQQSDYATLWSPGVTEASASTPGASDDRRADESLLMRAALKLYGYAPEPFKNLYRRLPISHRHGAFSNSKYFKRMRVP